MIYIHHNVPGVLRKGDLSENVKQTEKMLIRVVNAILGDHNVDKQMTDSRGDVSVNQSLA